MKEIKKALLPVYREDYLKGYITGLDPHMNLNRKGFSDAFHSGFDSGRHEYETMNGLVCAGIPARIVTRKTLEDFLLAGMLGLDIDSDGYTTFQLDVIEIWYRNGIEQYNPAQTDYLISILESEGIEL
jgi:hypothetical protein